MISWQTLTILTAVQQIIHKYVKSNNFISLQEIIFYFIVGCVRQKIVDLINLTNSFYSTLPMPLEIKKNSKKYIVKR